jgi:hypothetical protein
MASTNPLPQTTSEFPDFKNRMGVYDSTELNRLQSVFDTAWMMLVEQKHSSVKPERRADTRDLLAKRILSLSASERDDDRLLRAAIKFIAVSRAKGRSAA